MEMKSETGGFTRWLGFTKKNAVNTINSEFDIIELGVTGVTKNSLTSLAYYLGINRKTLAEDIFNFSVKTFERKLSNAKFDKKTSSHAIEIAKVIEQAFSVFRDEEKVRVWINTDNRALNYRKPIRLFDTLTGLVLVGDILGRIQEGVYS